LPAPCSRPLCLDVGVKKIPQKDRHLAIASGDIQCAAAMVETWISWNVSEPPPSRSSSSTSPTVPTAWPCAELSKLKARLTEEIRVEAVLAAQAH
jgi:hypothetical protein